MKKKNLIFGVVLCMAVLVSGCGRESTNSEEDMPEDEKVELTIWQHEPTEQRVTAWNTVIEKFQEENPNITVNMEVVLWDDAQAKMLNAIQSNTMPDMNVV